MDLSVYLSSPEWMGQLVATLLKNAIGVGLILGQQGIRQSISRFSDAAICMCRGRNQGRTMTAKTVRSDHHGLTLKIRGGNAESALLTYQHGGAGACRSGWA